MEQRNCCNSAIYQIVLPVARLIAGDVHYHIDPLELLRAQRIIKSTVIVCCVINSINFNRNSRQWPRRNYRRTRDRVAPPLPLGKTNGHSIVFCAAHAQKNKGYQQTTLQVSWHEEHLS